MDSNTNLFLSTQRLRGQFHLSNRGGRRHRFEIINRSVAARRERALGAAVRFERESVAVPFKQGGLSARLCVHVREMF